MKRVLRVSLVIAVYNQLLHTMQCLESILRLPDKAGELIIVDNASTDGTPEYLNSIGVTVIRNANNLGCAKGRLITNWTNMLRNSRRHAGRRLGLDFLDRVCWCGAWCSTRSDCSMKVSAMGVAKMWTSSGARKRLRSRRQ